MERNNPPGNTTCTRHFGYYHTGGSDSQKLSGFQYNTLTARILEVFASLNPPLYIPNKRDTQNGTTNNSLPGAAVSKSVVAVKQAISLTDINVGPRDNEQRQHEHTHNLF